MDIQFESQTHTHTGNDKKKIFGVKTADEDDRFRVVCLNIGRSNVFFFVKIRSPYFGSDSFDSIRGSTSVFCCQKETIEKNEKKRTAGTPKSWRCCFRWFSFETLGDFEIQNVNFQGISGLKIKEKRFHSKLQWSGVSQWFNHLGCCFNRCGVSDIYESPKI